MALLETLPLEVENTLREMGELELVTDPKPQLPQSRTKLETPSLESSNGTVSTLETEASDFTETEEELDDDPRAFTLDKPIVFASDLARQGDFGEEWLVVSQEKLYVFTPNGGQKAKLRHVIPCEDISEAKAEIKVGNGQIEVRTPKETVEVIRFSQASIPEAHAVTRTINALAKGDRLPEESLEEKRKACPKCKRILPEDSDVCPSCVNRRAVMLRLFRFLAPYKMKALASALIILASTLLGLLPPKVGGWIVDALGNQLKDKQSIVLLIVGFVAILALARLGNAALDYAGRRLQAWLGARISMDIRVAVYQKFNMLSLKFYDKRSTGSVMSRITNDSDQLWDFLTEGTPWLISNVISLLGIGIILFSINWQLALLVLAPGPLIYLLNHWFMPRARKRWHHLWHRISKMYSMLNSSLNGMRVVKAFHQEEREIGRFRDRNQQIFMASFQANSMWAIYWPVLSILMGIGTYIIWIFGGYKVLNKEMTLGDLTAFNGFLMQFYLPFQNFSRVMDWTTRSLTAAERVFEILDTEPDVKEAKNAVALPNIEGAVSFSRVCFSYDGAKRVLEDFTLEVKAGEMIGLVGHSGAGKSTIINLLARFYDVTEGSIKIDGVDIRNIAQDDFRRQMGIVLQEPFLFPGTIRENIAYARPDATIEEIMKAAKAANCHNFIMKFPDGYDTQAGERGQRLSGGERQRISIARAILHDPKILILDEATASVDTETEKQIQEAIARLIENRTTFAIAHRLSTLRNASRLVVMKEGKMVECGSHDVLMEEDGVYANLVKIQNEVNKIRAL